MSAVGIEVTPEAVRYLELKEHGQTFSVGRYGEELIKTPVGDDGEFPQVPAVKEILAGLKKKYGFDLVAVALPEEKAYTFSTEMPNLSPHEVREGLELKLEENVPIPPREAVFDYKIIDEKSADRIQIGVQVIPRLVASRYLELLTSVGLTPVSFNTSAQATIDAVIKRNDDRATIVVNFGLQSARLYLVSHRTVHFTSVVSVGGASLTEAIKKYFSVSDAEAEKIKSEQGITRRKEDADLFVSLVSTLSALKDEIEKIAEYWKSHEDRYAVDNLKISRVVLCGSESGLQGLPEYLEASLGLPVELGNVWSNVFSFDTYIPPIPSVTSLSYASVIGLALRGR